MIRDKQPQSEIVIDLTGPEPREKKSFELKLQPAYCEPKHDKTGWDA